MDLNELKKISRNGERIVLVENGEPTVVILSFWEYKRMLEKAGDYIESDNPTADNSSNDDPVGELVGDEPAAEQEEDESKPAKGREDFPAKNEDEPSKQSLTLEDLPF